MRSVLRLVLILGIAVGGAVISRASQASGDASPASNERPPSGMVLDAMPAKWRVTNVPQFVGDNFPESNELVADIGAYAQSQFLTAFVVKTFTAVRESTGIMAGAGLFVLTGVCWVLYRRVRRPASFGIYDAPDESEATPPVRRTRRLPGRHLTHRKTGNGPFRKLARLPSGREETTDRPLRAVRVLRSRGVLKRRIGDA